MSQSVGAHHEMGDNKAPGGPTSLTSGVSSGVPSSTFHGYEDPPGLHEKVPSTEIVPIGAEVEKDYVKIKGISCQCIFNLFPSTRRIRAPGELVPEG